MIQGISQATRVWHSITSPFTWRQSCDCAFVLFSTQHCAQPSRGKAYTVVICGGSQRLLIPAVAAAAHLPLEAAAVGRKGSGASSSSNANRREPILSGPPRLPDGGEPAGISTREITLCSFSPSSPACKY